MRRLVEKITVGEPWRPKRKPQVIKQEKSEDEDQPTASDGGHAESLGSNGMEPNEESMGHEQQQQAEEEEEDSSPGEGPDEEAARAAIKERMMLEGAQGIWELSCDRNHAARVTLEVLEALALALRSGPPAVQVVAMAAVWNLSVLADVRGAMVQVRGSLV